MKNLKNKLAIGSAALIIGAGSLMNLSGCMVATGKPSELAGDIPNIPGRFIESVFGFKSDAELEAERRKYQENSKLYHPGDTWTNEDGDIMIRTASGVWVDKKTNLAPIKSTTGGNFYDQDIEILTRNTGIPVLKYNKEKKKPYLELLVFNDWKNINNDKYMQKEELFGLGKKVFDSKEDMLIGVFYENCKGNITLQAWTDKGELIQEERRYIPNSRYNQMVTGIKDPNSKNFVDKLKEAGPGNYRITVSTESGIIKALDVTLVK